VLTVLELLQGHAWMSGPELAARLEVDVRTVRRYVAMLQELGIPVEAGRGRLGGYRLRPGFKLPPLMFTEDEALALTLSLLAARQLGLGVAAPAVEGALAKVERVLPPRLRERVRAVQETLVWDGSPPLSTPPSPVVAAFSEAARDRRRLRVRYLSWRGEETDRELDIYGLVYRGGYWYAAGHCHLRSEARVFRLDRVLRVQPSEETFTRPAEFDALEHVLRSLATAPGAWEVEVLLETSLEDARAQVPRAFATLEETGDGEVLLRCRVQCLGWVAHYLAGLGCPLVVRRPEELREELRRLAAHAAGLAARTER
jgi:predicted DNA-binding transcriptional regulator YafY